MPYLDNQHLNFCWKTPYKKVIMDAVAENGQGDVYGNYPDSTMTIHAGCGLIPSLREQKETSSGGGGGGAGPASEEESAMSLAFPSIFISSILFSY